MPFSGGGMDILWNYTIKLFSPNVKSKSSLHLISNGDKPRNNIYQKAFFKSYILCFSVCILYTGKDEAFSPFSIMANNSIIDFW